MGNDMRVARIGVGRSYVSEGSTPISGRSVGVTVWRAHPAPVPVADESVPVPIKPTRRTFARLPPTPTPPPAASVKRGGRGKKAVAPPPPATPKVVMVVKAPRADEAQPIPEITTPVEITPTPVVTVAPAPAMQIKPPQSIALPPAKREDVASLIGIAAPPKATVRRDAPPTPSRPSRSVRRSLGVPLAELRQISRPPSVLFSKTVAVSKEERRQRPAKFSYSAKWVRPPINFEEALRPPEKGECEEAELFAKKVLLHSVLRRIYALEDSVVERVHRDGSFRRSWPTMAGMFRAAMDWGSPYAMQWRKDTLESVHPFLLACERAQAKAQAAARKRR